MYNPFEIGFPNGILSLVAINIWLTLEWSFLKYFYSV